MIVIMNIIEIIAKKRDKGELSKDEIEYFVTEYTNGNVTDYQAAALVMAIYINGMTNRETTDLTLAMAHSGEILDLSEISDKIVDKHSTGGIGDKVSIALLPVIASLDIPVAKMSGRGLGITGGTIDKLESIPGYNTGIDIKTFIENVKQIGISLIGQTLNLAPADKKIYALRDTISCVDNIPLIASSVMSKKIAAGANKIVLDVTVGKGAFMKTQEEATKLAKTMKDIGTLANKETVCILTNMDEPLGYAVGNILEIKETVEILKGNIPEDVKEVILKIGAYIIKLAGHGDDIIQNEQMILDNIYNGKGYAKFLELIKKQGGDISYIENVDKFEKAKYIVDIKSEQDGYIEIMDARKIGEISCDLGAGRIKKEDTIDFSVGIVLNKKIGDTIKKDETILTIHANNEEKLNQALIDIKQAYKITDKQVNKIKCILDII